MRKKIGSSCTSTRVRFAALLAALFCLAFAALAFAAEPGVTSKGGHWDTATTEWFSQATGRDNDPYIIRTANDLAGLAKLCDGGELFAYKYIALANDIDLGGREWEPIGMFNSLQDNVSFNGTFDGRGHTISGLMVTKVDAYDNSLFATTGKLAVIRNLRLKGTSRGPAGASLFADWHRGLIENCVADGEASMRSDAAGNGYVGLFAAIADGGTIRNCVAFGSADATNAQSYCYGGGIIGNNAYGPAIIENCVAACSSVAGGMDAGGIMGANLSNGDIFNCVSVCDSVTAVYAGGVIGGYSYYGYNNFWLKEKDTQPELVYAYENHTGDATGKKAKTSELPVAAAVLLQPLTLRPGESKDITAALYPVGADASGLTFKWSSQNGRVASAAGSGVTATVTAVAEGETEVELEISDPRWLVSSDQNIGKSAKGKITLTAHVTVKEGGDDPDDPDDPVGSSSGGGCDAGLPFLALLLPGALPFLCRRSGGSGKNKGDDAVRLS